MKTLLITCGLLLTTPVLAQAPPQNTPTRTALERFQQAVTLEEQRGQTAEALKIYDALAKASATPLGLKARCGYRRGACLEALGRTAEARAAYRRVVKDYAALAKVVAQARAGLKRLAPRPQPSITEESSVTAAGAGHVAIEAKDADVRDLIEGVAKFGKIDFTIAPSVRGQVTLSLPKIEPLEALRLIVGTVGDYGMSWDPARRYARIATRSSFESDLVTRVYPLKRIRPGAKTEASRRGLLRTVEELVVSHRVAGASAIYDRRSQSLVVTHDRLHQDAVRAVLSKALRPLPAAPARDEPKVTIRFTDADVRTVLRLIGAYAKRPLLVAAGVRGQISLSLEQVPAPFAIREVAHACGDYAVFETPAATVVAPRGQVESWLVVERWPLRIEPRALWTLDEAVATPKPGRLPTHPLMRLLQEWVASTRVAGAAVAFDAGSNALLVQLPPPLRDTLRRTLARLGYVAPAPRPAPAKRLAKLEDVDIRAALTDVAKAAGLSLVVAPMVRGRVTGTYRADAAPDDLLRVLLKVTGDYEAVRLRPKLYRATSRSATENELQTARVQLQKRSGASAAALQRALTELVVASRVAGALNVLDAANRVFVLSLPRGLLARVQALIAASDQPDVGPKLEGLVIPTYWRAGPKTAGLPLLQPVQVHAGRAELLKRGPAAPLVDRYTGPGGLEVEVRYPRSPRTERVVELMIKRGAKTTTRKVVLPPAAFRER